MKAWPRYINMALGVWLIISAFIWPHTPSQQTNAWVVGVAAVAIALVAMAREQARYLNTALAVWLFVSIWALPTLEVATRWNSGLVAAALFIFSLIPNVRPAATRPARPAGGHAEPVGAGQR